MENQPDDQRRRKLDLHLDILGGCSAARRRRSTRSTLPMPAAQPPGKIEYAARCSGVVEGNRMSIAIAVPALQQTFGPFLLTVGVSNAWSPCLYP
jgi:hypothetical protein